MIQAKINRDFINAFNYHLSNTEMQIEKDKMEGTNRKSLKFKKKGGGEKKRAKK